MSKILLQHNPPESGRAVRLALTTGEAHDNRLAAKLLSRLKPGSMLLADRGYDADWIRTLVRQHGAWANILLQRAIGKTRSASARICTALEIWWNGLQQDQVQCRRVATRYDKLAANYLAFIQLASIRVWLRANESTP